MTATQRAVVDDLGNINIHGRSGLVIVWKVKNAEGSYIDISASDLFFEISGKIRIELTAGDDVYSRKASLTRTQIATLPLNQALAYALHDETPSSPCTIWSGLITAYGFKTAPSGAAAVDPGTASWSGATVTVQQGESVPTVVVTYMGATGYGVPTGGTSGQYLRKNSATEFDWGFDTITSADVSGLDGQLAAKQDLHANLTAFSGLSLVADSLPYANRTGTLAMATLTDAGRALLDDDDAPAQRATLGVVIGTDVQAQNARLQDIATNLSATSGAIEKTGANTFGTFTVTAAGKALIDDADVAAQRTTLGLGTAAVQNLASMAAMTMAGVLAFVAGTVSAPGLAVAGDLNTGVYGVSADVLGVSAGGSVVQTWGVGTSTLTGHLLRGADNAYDDGSPSQQIRTGYFGTSVVTPRVQSVGAGALLLNTNGTDRWQIGASGSLTAVAHASYNIGTSVSAGAPNNIYAAANVVAGGYLGVSNSAGNYRLVQLYTGANLRWTFGALNGAESGANAGSNFGLLAYDDSGTFLNTPLTIIRSTGAITTAGSLTLGGALLAQADNTYDIGASGASRPRRGYFGTEVVTVQLTASSHILGSGNVQAGATYSIYWNGRSLIQSPADGVLALYNNASTGFTGVKLGGLTASQPYLKVNGAAVQFRLADDTGFTKVQGQLQTHANAVAETPTATHTLVLYDAAGTAYRVLAVV